MVLKALDPIFDIENPYAPNIQGEVFRESCSLIGSVLQCYNYVRQTHEIFNTLHILNMFKCNMLNIRCCPQICSPWQIFALTSHVSSHSGTLCWVEGAGTLRTNITMLFTTWLSEEAVSVTDMPASAHLWTEDGGMSSPRPAWYGTDMIQISSGLVWTSLCK